MTKTKLLNSAFQYGVMAAILAMAMPGMAFADVTPGTDVAGLLDSFSTTQLPAFPKILGAVSYVGGAFMIVSGALKLKAHVESPNEKLAPAIARILVGGAITAVPTLTRLIQGSSIGTGGEQANYNAFSTSF